MSRDSNGRWLPNTPSPNRHGRPHKYPEGDAKPSIIAGVRVRDKPDPVLIGALRRAHLMLGRDAAGLPTLAAAPASPYERGILRLALLAPDIQQAILCGRQPAHLNLETIMNSPISLEWAGQRRALGFAS